MLLIGTPFGLGGTPRHVCFIELLLRHYPIGEELPHTLDCQARHIETCLSFVDFSLCCCHRGCTGLQTCAGFLGPVLGFTPRALRSAERGTGASRVAAGAVLGHGNFERSPLQLGQRHGYGGFRLVEAERKVPLIELGEELASLYLLMVLNVYGQDGAIHTCTQRHDIPSNIGVIG